LLCRLTRDRDPGFVNVQKDSIVDPGHSDRMPRWFALFSIFCESTLDFSRRLFRPVAFRPERIYFAVIAILLLLIPVLPLQAQPQVFHVAEFGAEADGTSIATKRIQAALDAAGNAGGGTVDFARGIYRTGALFLHSHTHLRIGSGVTLLGVSDPAAYPKVFTRAAGVEMQWPAALLNCDSQQDVSIAGRGVIDGNGKRWWDAFWSQVPEYESKGLRWAVDYDVQRPELLRVFRCSQVHLGGGLLLRRSAFWTVHVAYSTQITVSGITIRDNDPVEGKGPSTDGVDIDSSSHVLVEHVDIANNDDGICLKAGMNADGLRVNRPTEGVTIRHATIREGISGIAIGSDTAGGFRDIRISDITVLGGVRYGIYLKSTHTRGGWTENIRMQHVRMQGVQTAIKIDLDYFPAFSTPHIPLGIEHNLPSELRSIPDYWHTLAAPVPPVEGTPHFRDIHLDDIEDRGARTAIEVNAAADAPIERFSLSNVSLEGEHAGCVRHISGWTLRKVRVRAMDGKPLQLEDVAGLQGRFVGQ
jgi:hypothetical protein